MDYFYRSHRFDMYAHIYSGCTKFDIISPEHNSQAGRSTQ
jgi:hypothetical protein